MSKIKTQFVCQNCGYAAAKWMGRCPECSEWNSLVEEEQLKNVRGKSAAAGSAQKGALSLSHVESQSFSRMSSGIKEFDRVMGGGAVEGSLTLVGGQPGIGKSTLLMEVCGKLAKINPTTPIFYISGEESESQVGDRCKRLGINTPNLYLFHCSRWSEIKSQIEQLKPKVFVLDSIQTTYSEEVPAVPGSMSQIREVTFEVMNLAKTKNITAFIIGHVTKEGQIAGPKMLEHMVDTVIYFEGDQMGHYRMLRVIKNRFGNTNEVGIFEMSEEGLQEVPNPSLCFLDNPLENAFGRSLTCIFEGTRPLLLEIQALVVQNLMAHPRRTTQGIDPNRLAMLVAVIEKYFSIPIGVNDIYVNVVGGMKLNSRESDLSIVASLLSSLRSVPVQDDTVFVGEVGLTGEVRSVPFFEDRVKELSQLNYKKIITAQKAAEKLTGKYKIQLVGLKRANELERVLF